MKLPGTYAAYAVIMTLFGQSPAGIHLGLALVNAASIALVYLIGRRLLDPAAGVAAAVAFALMTLSPTVLGLAGHATHFVTFFALAGLWALLHIETAPAPRPRPTFPPSHLPTFSPPTYAPSHLPTCSVLAGLCFGLAFLMKHMGFSSLCLAPCSSSGAGLNRAAARPAQVGPQNPLESPRPARSHLHQRARPRTCPPRSGARTPPGRAVKRLSLIAQAKAASEKAESAEEKAESRKQKADNGTAVVA
jgi:hypothetical protein